MSNKQVIEMFCDNLGIELIHCRYDNKYRSYQIAIKFNRLEKSNDTSEYANLTIAEDVRDWMEDIKEWYSEVKNIDTYENPNQCKMFKRDFRQLV